MIVVPLAAAVVAVLVLSGTRAVHRPVRTPETGIARSTGEQRRRSWARLPRRRPHLQPAAVAAWCDDLSRELRHGSTLRSAIETTIPADAVVADHTETVRHLLSRGDTVSTACDEWSRKLDGESAVGIDVLGTLATVLSATASLGGNNAEPIDRFGITMRQRTSDDLERAANSAQARMSARVLTVVPLALLAVLFATDPGVRGAVTSSRGLMVVGVGLALNGVGAWWMRRIAGAPAMPTRPPAPTANGAR